MRRTSTALALTGVLLGLAAPMAGVAVTDRAPAWAQAKQYNLHPIASSPWYFGTSVAIQGNTVYVGAAGCGSPDCSTGAIYVYEKPRSGWKNMHEVAKLTIHGQHGEQLGMSLATLPGGLVVAGAPHGRPEDLRHRGEVVIFKRPGNGWRTTSHPLAILSTPRAGNNKEFGAAIAATTVGKHGQSILVGDPGQEINGVGGYGTAYVLSRPGSTWHDHVYPHPPRLSEPNGRHAGSFGGSVAFNDATAVVAAAGERPIGNVYGFQRPSGGWVSTDTPTRTYQPGPDASGFGWAVASAGAFTAVGAPGIKEQVDIYDAQNSSSTPDQPIAVINDPAKAWNDGFGRSVALSPSDDTLVVGVPDSGKDGTGTGEIDVFEPTFPTAGPTRWVLEKTFQHRPPQYQAGYGQEVAVGSGKIAVGYPQVDFEKGGGAQVIVP